MRLLDTAIHGCADSSNPERDKDRLDLAASIAPLGQGERRSRGEGVPRDIELLGAMFEGLAGQRIPGYRGGINCSLCGSRVCLLFDLRGASGVRGRASSRAGLSIA